MGWDKRRGEKRSYQSDKQLRFQLERNHQLRLDALELGVLELGILEKALRKGSERRRMGRLERG